MPHTFKFNPIHVNKIGEIIPRLLHSVSVGQVIHWLENFDENEVDLALELLGFLEHINTSELFARLDERVRDVLSQFPDAPRYVFYPIAKYPKSPDYIAYLISKLQFISELKSTSQEVIITRDYEKCVPYPQGSVFIMVDDFIGSGGSFEDEYQPINGTPKLKAWLDQHVEITERVLMASIIMKQGLEKASTFREVYVSAEKRLPVFEEPSVFQFLSQYHVNRFKDLVERYFNGFAIRKRDAVFGYDNTQALVSFEHTTPNNTLPLIWSEKNSKKGNWFPIYPRFSHVRIDQIRRFKKGIAYSMNVMRYLGLDKKFSIQGIKERYGKYEYHSQKDYLLLSYLILRSKNFSELIIRQIFGLTEDELRDVKKRASEDDLASLTGLLTGKGSFLVNQILAELTRLKQTSEAITSELESVNLIHYVPKTFRGKS